jgi:hypothetical protein
MALVLPVRWFIPSRILVLLITYLAWVLAPATHDPHSHSHSHSQSQSQSQSQSLHEHLWLWRCSFALIVSATYQEYLHRALFNKGRTAKLKFDSARSNSNLNLSPM